MRLVFLLFAGLLFTPAARADMFSVLCRFGLSVIGVYQPVARVAPPWTDWPALRSRLRTARERWLAQMRESARFLPRGIPRIGDRIEVLGGSYRIVEYLGGGNEGHVYVVDTPGGLKIVKRFREGISPAFSAEGLADSPHPTPRVEYIDEENRTMMMEYLPTLPLTALATELGLTLNQLHQIDARFRERMSGVQNQNTILNVETGVFMVADPH